MSKVRGSAGIDPSMIAGMLPQWRTLAEDDWSAEPATTFNADGPWVLSNGNIWYKENTAAETFPPAILPGLGLRWTPNNAGDLAGRANGLLSTRNSDLSLLLPATTPIRMSFMIGGANQPTANSLRAFYGLEVSPPGGAPPQQHCIYGRWGANGIAPYPASATDWYSGNVYNNTAGVVGGGDTAASLIALRCHRVTMGHGVLPWHVTVEVAQAGALSAWPLPSAWNVRGFGADWNTWLSYNQAFGDVASRGTFNAWGQVLTASRGFAAAADAYIVVTKTKLEAWY